MIGSALLAAEAGEMDGLAVGLALAASVGLIVLNGFYVAYEFAVLAAASTRLRCPSSSKLDRLAARTANS